MKRFFDNPYVLLTLTALLWGANGVASRLAVGEVSPMVLTTMRWVIACAFLLAFAAPRFVADLPVLRTRLPRIFLMSLLGFTGFNALFYLAGHYTSATNLTISQGAIPVFVLIGAFFVHGVAIRGFQVVGMVVALSGLLVVASAGDLGRLRDLAFNFGDLMMGVACLIYAGYTVALRDRPNVSGIGFFAALGLVAALTSLPLLGLEWLLGQQQWPTPKGWAILLFVGLGPSLLSQLFFMRGVQQIGPGRAGVFVNLVPIFGPLLAFLVLGEDFAPHHALALALVVGGITVAERGRPPVEGAAPAKGRA